MKKKIVALFLAMCLFGGVCSASAMNFSAIDQAAESMLTYTKQDRADMLTLLAPMLIRDSGLDSLIEVIDRYQPGSEGLLAPYLEYALRYTDKETLKKTVNSLRMIDQYVREDYIKKFQNREEKQLSSAEKSALESLLAKMDAKAPHMKILCEEDGITSGVLANLMQAVYEANGKQQLFYYDGTQYTLRRLDSTVSRKIREVWNVDGKTWIKSVIQELNDRDANEKNQIFQVLNAVNIAEKYNSRPPVNGSGSGSTSTPSEPSTPTEETTYLPRYEIVADTQGLFDIDTDSFVVIRVEMADKDGNVTQQQPKEAFCLEIPVSDPKATLYRIDKAQVTPVPFSVCDGEKLTALFHQTGYYGIKTNPDYFMDMQGLWGQQFVESLYQRGIISGKADYTFVPEDSITREEFVKLIVAGFGLVDETATVSFEDVSQGDWYYPYVASAYQKGIVKGVDTAHFGVGQKITREDMVTMISNMLNAENLSLSEIAFHDFQQISEYAQNAVKIGKTLGLISGDEQGYFHPKENATRQEAAKMIYLLLKSYTLREITLR